MTHTEIDAWFALNLDRKAKELGVPHFRIRVVQERLETGKMTCEAHPEYERATIRVDVSDYADDVDASVLEADFEHELMHIVHSPFDILRAHLYELMGKEEACRWNAVASLFDHCAEMTVRNMERMRYGLRAAAKSE